MTDLMHPGTTHGSEANEAPATNARDGSFAATASEPSKISGNGSNGGAADFTETALRQMVHPSGGVSDAKHMPKLETVLQSEQREGMRRVLLEVLKRSSPEVKVAVVRGVGLKQLETWVSEAVDGFGKGCPPGEDGSAGGAGSGSKSLVMCTIECLATLPMELDSLKRTGIGRTIGLLRKQPYAELVAASKLLIDQWKRMMDSKEADGQPGGSGEKHNREKPEPAAATPKRQRLETIHLKVIDDDEMLQDAMLEPSSSGRRVHRTSSFELSSSPALSPGTTSEARPPIGSSAAPSHAPASGPSSTSATLAASATLATLANHLGCDTAGGRVAGIAGSIASTAASSYLPPATTASMASAATTSSAAGYAFTPSVSTSPFTAASPSTAAASSSDLGLGFTAVPAAAGTGGTTTHLGNGINRPARLGSLKDGHSGLLGSSSRTTIIGGAASHINSSVARTSTLFGQVSQQPPQGGLGGNGYPGELVLSGTSFGVPLGNHAAARAAAARARQPSPEPDSEAKPKSVKAKSVSWVSDEKLVQLRWFRKDDPCQAAKEDVPHPTVEGTLDPGSLIGGQPSGGASPSAGYIQGLPHGSGPPFVLGDPGRGPGGVQYTAQQQQQQHQIFESDARREHELERLALSEQHEREEAERAVLQDRLRSLAPALLWSMPPMAVQDTLTASWKVCYGEASLEVSAMEQRASRLPAVAYPTPAHVPPSPAEPPVSEARAEAPGTHIPIIPLNIPAAAIAAAASTAPPGGLYGGVLGPGGEGKDEAGMHGGLRPQGSLEGTALPGIQSGGPHLGPPGQEGRTSEGGPSPAVATILDLPTLLSQLAPALNVIATSAPGGASGGHEGGVMGTNLSDQIGMLLQQFQQSQGAGGSAPGHFPPPSLLQLAQVSQAVGIGQAPPLGMGGPGGLMGGPGGSYGHGPPQQQGHQSYGSMDTEGGRPWARHGEDPHNGPPSGPNGPPWDEGPRGPWRGSDRGPPPRDRAPPTGDRDRERDRERERDRDRERERDRDRSSPGRAPQPGRGFGRGLGGNLPSSKLCMFFNAPQGCNNGDGCRFVHARAGSTDGGWGGRGEGRPGEGAAPRCDVHGGRRLGYRP